MYWPLKLIYCKYSHDAISNCVSVLLPIVLSANKEFILITPISNKTTHIFVSCSVEAIYSFIFCGFSAISCVCLFLFKQFMNNYHIQIRTIKAEIVQLRSDVNEMWWIKQCKMESKKREKYLRKWKNKKQIKDKSGMNSVKHKLLKNKIIVWTHCFLCFFSFFFISFEAYFASFQQIIVIVSFTLCYFRYTFSVSLLYSSFFNSISIHVTREQTVLF